MTPSLTIARAGPGHGRDIAQLIAASLHPRLRRLTIWQSGRAGRYVETLLRAAWPAAAGAFYLLRCNSQLAGLAAFRLLDDAAFLNHLYLIPRFRARGWGARLFAQALRDYLHSQPSSTVALDVFSPRPLVESWYARLGFRERSRTDWCIAPPLPGGNHGSTGCLGLAAARRQHQRWGFSSFTVVTAAGRYHIGRLPAPYFRLTDPAAACDPQLSVALSALDPRRRLLLVAPACGCKRPAATTRRLEIEAVALLRRLPASGLRKCPILCC